MIKFALIGCGRIALRHAELLGNETFAAAELVSVCDVDTSKASALGRRFKVPYFSDYHQMLQSVETDVVVILTESGNHALHALDISSHRKHLIIEKPIGLNISQVENMIDVYQRIGKNIFVVKQNRLNVPIVRLREALDSGRFGRLVFGSIRVRWCRDETYYSQAKWRGTWSLDGGVLTNQASHHIDLLLWMMGPVESVHARGITALSKIDAEDTAVVSLKFVNGALGVIEATSATRPRDIEGSISILGERGIVEVGGFAVNKIKVWEFSESCDSDHETVERYSTNPPDVYGFGHRSYYEHVIRCLNGGQSQVVDGNEAIKSLKLLHSIYVSIEEEREVFLKEGAISARLGN